MTIKHCVLLFIGILQFNEHIYLQHSERTAGSRFTGNKLCNSFYDAQVNKVITTQICFNVQWLYRDTWLTYTVNNVDNRWIIEIQVVQENYRDNDNMALETNRLTDLLMPLDQLHHTVHSVWFATQKLQTMRQKEIKGSIKTCLWDRGDSHHTVHFLQYPCPLWITSAFTSRSSWT